MLDSLDGRGRPMEQGSMGIVLRQGYCQLSKKRSSLMVPDLAES